jgi:hypothetical protein
MMLLLEVENGAICAVPPQWTDVVATDPEIILGGQRALFRVADLVELACMVDRLSRGLRRKGEDCGVKQTLPQV